MVLHQVSNRHFSWISAHQHNVLSFQECKIFSSSYIIFEAKQTALSQFHRFVLDRED